MVLKHSFYRNLNDSKQEYHKTIRMAQPDLSWGLCAQLMKAEVSQQLDAGKSERSAVRNRYRCSYRSGRLDMRIATMHLVMSEVRQGGYIRISNAHPDEPGTYIQGVSTPTGGKACKREPAPQLGQREEKGTTRQVNIFRSCYRLTQPLDRGSNNRLLLLYTSIYNGGMEEYTA